ncbi:hypothetical protein L218DRAFT_985877 [Marasmius fiardii PR-910]|nr:hypothetical protein L218DRAFT_985877 [Marasmius fiardii PR-910]
MWSRDLRPSVPVIIPQKFNNEKNTRSLVLGVATADYLRPVGYDDALPNRASACLYHCHCSDSSNANLRRITAQKPGWSLPTSPLKLFKIFGFPLSAKQAEEKLPKLPGTWFPEPGTSAVYMSECQKDRPTETRALQRLGRRENGPALASMVGG